jgi:hypothetical protein
VSFLIALPSAAAATVASGEWKTALTILASLCCRFRL